MFATQERRPAFAPQEARLVYSFLIFANGTPCSANRINFGVYTLPSYHWSFWGIVFPQAVNLYYMMEKSEKAQEHRDAPRSPVKRHMTDTQTPETTSPFVGGQGDRDSGRGSGIGYCTSP